MKQRVDSARRLIQTSQFKEAIAQLDIAIQTAPELAAAYNLRAFAWFKLYENERALADLNTAIRLNPNFENAYHIRSVVRSRLGDSAGAEADLRQEQMLRAGQ